MRMNSMIASALWISPLVAIFLFLILLFTGQPCWYVNIYWEKFEIESDKVVLDDIEYSIHVRPTTGRLANGFVGPWDVTLHAEDIMGNRYRSLEIHSFTVLSREGLEFELLPKVEGQFTPYVLSPKGLKQGIRISPDYYEGQNLKISVTTLIYDSPGKLNHSFEMVFNASPYRWSGFINPILDIIQNHNKAAHQIAGTKGATYLSL